MMNNKKYDILASVICLFLAFLVIIYLENNKKYEVTFDTYGGSIIPNQKVREGQSVIRPADPIKEGYIFDGWYYYDEEYQFTEKVVQDIILDATWIKDDGLTYYDVLFNTNGGSRVSVQKVAEGNKPKKPDNPTKVGYIFKEWQLNGKTYNFNSAIKSDITLSAVWTKAYTIKFNTNGGSSISNQKIAEGKSVKKPNNPIKDGYIFKEWQLNGETYNFNSAVKSNITLDAVWTKVSTYTVKFNTNGGSSISEQNVIEGNKVEKPTDPTKDGYIFKEWQLDGNTYDFNSVVKNNITLDAVWNAVPKNSYKVKYIKNNAMSIGATISVCKVLNNTCIVQMPTIIAQNGYEVVGWSSDINGNSKIYLPEKNYNISADMTLYAITKKVNNFLSGSELSKFKSDNNVNKSSDFVVEKTSKSVSGITFSVYYVYDITEYDSTELEDFKSFAQRSLNRLSVVDVDVLKYMKSNGTDLIFFGSHTCDAYLVEIGASDYTYAGYCNSYTRDIIVSYDEDTFDLEYYEKAIIHEFGHAFDFTLRYTVIGDRQSGISQLTKDNIVNGFTNKNNKFITSSKLSPLYAKDASGNVYSWTDLVLSDVENLSKLDEFSAYSVNDLQSRPHEYFAETFKAYYDANMRKLLKSTAPNTYAGIEKVIEYIK